MRKFFYAFLMLVIVISAGTIKAQSYDFEDYNIGDTFETIGWGAADLDAEVADDPLASGNNVLECTVHNYNAAPVLEFTLPAGKTLADYAIFTYKAYFAQGDVGWKDIIVEASQEMPTEVAYQGNLDVELGKVNRATGGSTAWEDITIDITNSSSLSGTIYVTFGINCAGTGNIGGDGVTTIWYADDIKLIAPNYVSDWGLTPRGTGWPILNDEETSPGDASMGSDESLTAWTTMQGSFGMDVTPTTDEALIVTGQLEYVGGGTGGSYVPLRYALTYQEDQGTLEYQYTDSAAWVDPGVYYGYQFTPPNGTADIPNGGGGAGVVWIVNGGGGWNSTWSNNGYPLITVEQAPRRAIIEEGVYDFAISVQRLGDGTNEIRWFLMEENETYWNGGVTIDTAQVATKFNGICFGIGDDLDETLTEFKVVDVLVDRGDPITVPKAPWEAFYVEEWGFIGDRIGGWTLTPGEVVGNVSIGGSANSSWSAVRGGFGINVTPDEEDAFIITGEMELEGGGFGDFASLRWGVFHSDSAGTVDTTDYTWSGIEGHHSGYLFLPHHGSNVLAQWPSGSSTLGTWGAVVDASWISTNGADNYVLGEDEQNPAGAESDAGTYEFAVSVGVTEDGYNDVRVLLTKDDETYAWGAQEIDHQIASDKFNCICFAISNATTTALNLVDVKVDMGDPIDLPDWVEVSGIESNPNAIPTEFQLSQNYPNPFNPTTKIEFGLPQQSDVKLVIYDIRGRAIATLVDGTFNAGHHTVTFDASHLASGVYFYKLEAKDFVNVKKLMLMK